MESKITAEDLRIGNLLNYGGEIREISSIHSDNTIRFKDQEKGSIGCFSTNMLATTPIPLDEKRLVKMGFKVNIGGRFGNEYHLDGFILYTSEKGTICFLWNNFMLDIYFIHDLQNLHFSLKRTELTIKPE